MRTVQLWKWIGIQGVLTLAFGLPALVWPATTALLLLGLLMVFGIGSTIAAVVAAIRREDILVLVFVALYSFFALGIAISGLLLPEYAMLACLIGVIIQALLGGVALIGYGVWQRRHQVNGWPALVSGIIITLIGIAIWFLPPAAPDAVVPRIGIYALIQGLLLGGAALLVRMTNRSMPATRPATRR